MTQALTPTEILFQSDAPLVLTLSDGEAPWLAFAVARGPDGLLWRAAVVNAPELTALKAGELLPHDYLKGRTSRLLAADPWRFIEDHAEAPWIEDLPAAGRTLREDWRLLTPSVIGDEAMLAFFKGKDPVLGSREGVEVDFDPPLFLASMRRIYQAYGWTIDVDGRVCALIAGDQGYAATHIVIPQDHLDAYVEDRFERGAIREMGNQRRAILGLMKRISFHRDNGVDWICDTALGRYLINGTRWIDFAGQSHHCSDVFEGMTAVGEHYERLILSAFQLDDEPSRKAAAVAAE